MNNEDNWKQAYQKMIEEKQEHLQNYLTAIEDQVKRGILSEYQVIMWGQEVKKMRDKIDFHRELFEKFKNEIE